MGGTKTHEAVQLLKGFNADPVEAATLVEMAPTPSPGKDQVLVHLLCRPVNPSDLMALKGVYPAFQPKKFPIAVGSEGMGKISEVGENVTIVHVGQRVYPMFLHTDETGQASWQEYIVVPASDVFVIPDSLSDEVASQFISNPWTVYSMLHHLEVPKGEYIIQSGGASVLGRMLIQLAKHEGIKTINLVRRDQQIEELKALGADEVINYTNDVVATRVTEVTGGKMAYAGVDPVSGDVTQLVVSGVRNSGEILVYGALDSFVSKVSVADLIFRDVRVHGWYVTKWIADLSLKERQATGAAIMDLLVKKVLRPHIGENYPLSKFKEAIAKSQQGRGGKVFLINDK